MTSTWKQNRGFWEPLVTGGNCRKSPQMMSWIPPKGLFCCRTALDRSRECFMLVGKPLGGNHQTHASVTAPAVHTDLATASNLSNKSASTMEISSMTNRWQFSHPCRTPGLWARATHWARGAWPEPMPVGDTIQSMLKSQLHPHLSPPSHRLGLLLTEAQGFTLTCKGVKGGAPDLAGCHPSAGSGHSARRGQGTQNMLQQIGLSCPWAGGKVRFTCSPVPCCCKAAPNPYPIPYYLHCQ